MPRDYKKQRKSAGSGLSGGTGLILGLSIGLGVALAVYLYDHRSASTEPLKPVAAKHPTPRSAEDNGEEQPGKKYDFYEMLPKFEVVVPEREKADAAASRVERIQRPGDYVLQAGSYRNFADADRVRAKLALQGIESKVQRVTVDNDTWHRIRIGPMSDLNELNRTRALLRAANIEALVIRVGD